jgi:putative ABC transport system ATP-binding protein
MAEVPLIRLSGITKHYGSGDARVDALKGIDFEVSAGSVAALAGKSGSGKSTLLNVIGCILAPNSGRMEIDGEVIADGAGWIKKDYRHLRLRKIGFIFQFHNLIPFLTCVQNIELVMKLAGTGRKQARRRALELLDYLGVAHRSDRLPATLSGGEAQRVAIARALANSPRIVLADEPTASLDSARTLAVLDLLRRLAREQEAAVLIVTHDEQVVARCDRIYQMSGGTIEGGSADDMYFNKFRRLRQRPDAAAPAPSA